MMSDPRLANFFGGEPPTTPDGYFKQFALSIGVSATNFAKNRRPTSKLAESKQGPRGLAANIPVSKMFFDRFCTNTEPGMSPRYNMTTDDVSKILESAKNDPDDETQQQLKKAVKGRTTPIQVLTMLRHAILMEGLVLSWDYFCMHRFCWRLLRAVKESLDGDFKRIYGPTYLETENQLPFVVGYIFMTAVEADKIQGFLKAKKIEAVTLDLIEKAGDVLKGLIETGADGITIKMLNEGMGVGIEFEQNE